MERKRERVRKRDRMRERNDQPICEARGREREYMENTNIRNQPTAIWADQPICEARGREREYMENTNETEVNTMDQFSVLQCVEVCCVCCSVVQCGAVWCSVVQCGAVWCSVVQCGAV